MGPHRVVNSCTIDPPRTGRGGTSVRLLRAAHSSRLRSAWQTKGPLLLAIVLGGLQNTQSIAARPLFIAAKTHQGTGFSQRVLAKIKNPKQVRRPGWGSRSPKIVEVTPDRQQGNRVIFAPLEVPRR